MGDIAMAAKPVAKAVIGALIVVLGLVCVLNLSSEEQIRVEDKVVAQVGGDQDDLTPAEKNLIAAASSHKITPAQQTQLKKEQQATGPLRYRAAKERMISPTRKKPSLPLRTMKCSPSQSQSCWYLRCRPMLTSPRR